ncbi:helix-turn-helix domain-containing protein [Catenuloplanes japonicus]|uniref:helix-turn-helix domain-containing protein n=1 Tax=Catenuloplanes japonicus TaxID=33876 RepID=UPI0005261D14|nr:helix-turn-helix domain-containing protein [Catenuloplanes japonicus]
MENSEIAARLALIEARLTALEGAEPSSADVTTGASAGVSTGTEDERFFALNGIRHTVDSGIVYAGHVELPTGAIWDWQWGPVPTAITLEADWSASVRALSALAHPVRLRLLREVLLGTRTATELGELDGLGTTGQLYHHLKQLVTADWLRSSSRGVYDVPGERVVPLLVILTASAR